ncbi:MAG: hypothetical protein JRG76_09280, partial [Deltaproteobacteria bacterium]|nr:hypothetical protein [Deltaproteobacteria bacterium]
MTPPSRLVHSAIALAVAFAITEWAAAPAGPVQEDAVPEPSWQRIEIARIETAPAKAPRPPRPRPPGIPAAAPEPEPVAKPVAEAEPTAPSARAPITAQAGAASARANLERGRELLDAGVFPRLRASYQRIGFEAYRDAVLALGGGFFLFDARARRPLAEIDPRTGETRSEAVREGLSRWPRDVTRHLPAALERGRQRFGDRASRVILLPPAAVDAALLGALDAHLRTL